MMFPVALELGPDGDVYVGLPVVGADRGEGVIVRVAQDGAATPAAGMAGQESACTPVPETVAPPHADATPEAVGMPT